ncbi:MAG: glucose 1-dehydrogenase [Alphaproteobacteria bacterium]|nr:glucose 1-dehydrogenase [Alphaproteobacteria bacterium]
MSGRVAGKIVLVTGAASGLGRAGARRLAEEGASVILADLDGKGAEAAAAEIMGAGGNAVPETLDVTEEAGWARILAMITERFGRIDVLVNNAGVAIGRPLLATSLDEWRALHAVNMEGVFLGTKAAVAAMIPGGGGSIINVSSIAGLIGAPMMSAYCASKGGVRLFSKAVALECAQMKWNIRVNSIHPAFVWTPMVQRHAAETGDPDRTRAWLESVQPIGRMGEPREIADGMLFLASDESSFITGSELVIDGGLTAA